MSGAPTLIFVLHFNAKREFNFSFLFSFFNKTFGDAPCSSETFGSDDLSLTSPCSLCSSCYSEGMELVVG